MILKGNIALLKAINGILMMICCIFLSLKIGIVWQIFTSIFVTFFFMYLAMRKLDFYTNKIVSFSIFLLKKRAFSYTEIESIRIIDTHKPGEGYFIKIILKSNKKYSTRTYSYEQLKNLINHFHNQKMIVKLEGF